MKQEPVTLSDEARECVQNTIDEVCAHRKWNLHAHDVRTNHVHIAVSGFASGEKMMTDIKAYATRNLRAQGFFAKDVTIWAEHGSTPHFDCEAELLRIYNYIVFGQTNREREA